MATKFEELMALDLSEGQLLILTHHNPDPDSVASAAALRYVLRLKRDIDSTVAYSGIIGRAENRAMVEELDLQLRHLSELVLDDYRYVALVDAQPHTGNNALPDDRDAYIVIDHHPLRDATLRAKFFDVREGIGASATVMTEYLRQARLDIPAELATALVYGIRSETQDLAREVSEADLQAYEFLFPLADRPKLAKIARPKLTRRYYAQLAVALDQMVVGRSVAICPLQEITDPDFVPEVADLAVRMEGIEWALAYGAHDGRLYLSIRAHEEGAHAGALMQKILDGVGKGGGHGLRAGGNIELDKSDLPRREIEKLIRERFLAETNASAEQLQKLEPSTEARTSSDDR